MLGRCAMIWSSGCTEKKCTLVDNVYSCKKLGIERDATEYERDFLKLDM